MRINFPLLPRNYFFSRGTTLRKRAAFKHTFFFQIYTSTCALKEGDFLSFLCRLLKRATNDLSPTAKGKKRGERSASR